MKKRVLSVLLCAVMSVVMLMGCGNKSAEKDGNSKDKKTLRLACVAFNYDEVNDPVAINKLKELGYDVKVTVMEDATTMNEACMKGELDASLHQHKPWMDAYNKSKKRNMVMLKPYIHYNVFGMYSKKWKNVKDIPNGAKVCLAEDSSNQSRGLLMLQKLGMIKIKDGVTVPTTLDIAENPKNLKFTTVDVAQVMSSLPDVDICLSAKMFQVSNKVSEDTEIYTSDDLYNFGVGFVVSPDNANAKWAKDLVDAYTTAEMKKEINKIFKGCYVPGK
ncbi:MetQ/NlpA family ABC transporter substrate-binding protein [Clostridium ljungdahlii]|uniref:D-methionine-binding lipoprotein MetQ n=1 Tax=Clostridium ljungdahlii TaxID=1538 RepID=A0A162J824_9CLOT|nr:MetQ/NlpA family ABC transporter substrate-binding protein [Clostridium ljungdahlii]OAA91645.1 D-methionine-binding lipoprotein MetQ precursor [Clostridium ljungdahlii]